MKLLYDNEIFSRQRYGGISRYFYEIIKRLTANNYIEADLFLGINNSGFEFDNKNSNLKINSIKLKNIDKLHLAVHPLNKILFNRFSSNNNFNIFHKTYYSTLGLDIKRPLISTIHDMTHELFPEYFAEADNTTELKKRSILHSDGIICVSETTKKDLLKIYNINEEKIKVIYHGLTLKDIPGLKRLITEPYIIYVGQRWGYKNFNLLLKAFAISNELKNNFKLICFGGGSLNYFEKVLIKDLNLVENVIYRSGNDKDLISAYQNAGAMIYTSLYEGFGFPPLEAMECGCPVISSEAGSVKEISGDNVLYYEQGNFEDLAAKISKVINDTELAGQMIIGGKKKVKEYNWDKSASEHYNFYKNI